MVHSKHALKQGIQIFIETDLMQFASHRDKLISMSQLQRQVNLYVTTAETTLEDKTFGAHWRAYLIKCKSFYKFKNTFLN